MTRPCARAGRREWREGDRVLVTSAWRALDGRTATVLRVVHPGAEILVELDGARPSSFSRISGLVSVRPTELSTAPMAGEVHRARRDVRRAHVRWVQMELPGTTRKDKK